MCKDGDFTISVFLASKADSTTIHSHPTEVTIQDGQAYPHSASTPSSTDRSTFKGYGTNVILGPIGTVNSVTKNPNGSFNIPNRSNGAVIYQKGKTPASIKSNALKKIIK